MLLQRYLDVIVQPDELVLFLEIKGDLDFNTVMHIKSGTDLTHRKDLPFKEIINFSNLHKVEISGAKIKNLIEKEIYKDKHSFMRWFFSITNALAGNLFSFFTKDIVKEGAEGFKTIANKIQEYRLDENRWNPEPKEGEYNPVFIPDEYAKRMEKAYLHQEYDNPNQNVKAQRNIISQISKNFFDELSHTKSFALDTLKETKQYLPTVLYNKLQSIVNYVFKQIDSIEKAISDPFAALGQLIYKKQKIVNAFLCGIYNSIIDIIAGIFSLVAFIFEAVYTIEDVKDQTFIYAEMLVELFENLAEGLLNFNFAEFFFNWITFEIKTLFRLINFIETLAKTSLEKYAYYYGYIVGIVIDIIVETLLTGGAAAVEKLLQSVETFLRNPLQKIAKTIEKSAIFVENVLQKIINFLDFLAKKLKKGATELFEELEKLLNEIFGFGEEVSDHALTPSERRYKDKLKAQQERIERKNRRWEIKKTDAERKRRIKKFWKDGYDPDPTFSIWGSGKISHPELWKSIMDDLASKGCEISYGERNLTYGASTVRGEPGVLTLTEDASITALKHEAKHFLDDFANGFPGLSHYMQNPKQIWKMEYDAYMIEIKFLRENKEFDTAKKLLKNALEEKKRIEDFYNVKL